MEGYLLKWVNPFQRWQKRYFILNDHILTYCDHPGQRSKGQIHLKVAGIEESKDDALKIIIHTGTGIITLKAANVDDKNQWLKALISNQEYCQRHQVFNYNSRIQELLTEIWTNFAQFDQHLTLLQEKVSQTLYKPISEIISLGQALKNGITLCCSLIEEEKTKIFGDSNTIYESFNFEDEIPLNTQPSYLRFEEQKQNSLDIFNLHEHLESIRLVNPIKYHNIKHNRVFQRLQITNNPIRTSYSYKQDPDEKFAFWSFLKDCIGKDLTRIPMPLLFHQPLSALQFFATSFEYYDLLKKAATVDDPHKRLAYLIAFSLIRCILGIDCQKKFFNPVLGETYEYITPEYKIISEQVCHHPPITAVHCESDEFILQITMEATVGFSGTSIMARLPGLVHFKSKKHNEHITYSLPSIIVKNLLFGKMYFEQVGEAIYTNHTTGDVGILTLQERTSEKDAYQVKAIIKDKHGTIRSRLTGFFNKEIHSNNELIWKRNPIDQEMRWYYHYTKHIMQINYLNGETLKSIPQTDSRMRSDMIALENGWKDLGQEEKVRIEEKQRERRKIMEEKKEHHVPRFFKEEFDPISKRNYWVYLGNYERDKHLIDLDLF